MVDAESRRTSVGEDVACLLSSAEVPARRASRCSVFSDRSVGTKALPQFLQNFASFGLSALQKSHDFIGAESLVPLVAGICDKACSGPDI